MSIGIALQATEDQTAAMIRRAPTDSDRHITYDPAGRPAVANLLDLLAAATGDTSQDLAETISDGGAGQLKQTLIDALNERLRPLRRRRAEFVEDRDYLNDVLDAGNQRARQLAHDTLTQVHEVLGMSYSNR